MNVRKWIYSLLFFVWCCCGCCLWSGNTVFAATDLSSPSDALLDQDGKLIDSEVIDDLGYTGDLTINHVKADLGRTNAELASISNALSLLSRSVTASSVGNVSSSVASIFDRIVMGLDPRDHYVLIRESENGYRLYYGDIKLSGSRFTGSARSVYYNTGTYSSSSYMQFNDSLDDISINVGTYLTYSSLGRYPRLGGVSDEEKAFHFMLFVMYVTFLVWGIFKLCLFGRIRK